MLIKIQRNLGKATDISLSALVWLIIIAGVIGIYHYKGLTGLALAIAVLYAAYLAGLIVDLVLYKFTGLRAVEDDETEAPENQSHHKKSQANPPVNSQVN